MPAKYILTLILLWLAYSPLQAQNETSRISKDSLKAYVSILASDSFAGRALIGGGKVKAAKYLGMKFRDIGLLNQGVSNNDFLVRNSNAPTLRNVVGYLLGKDSTAGVILISAHYDHIGILSNANRQADTVFNGANDNASGTAVMLEIARYFVQKKTNRHAIVLLPLMGKKWGFSDPSLWQVRQI